MCHQLTDWTLPCAVRQEQLRHGRVTHTDGDVQHGDVIGVGAVEVKTAGCEQVLYALQVLLLDGLKER